MGKAPFSMDERNRQIIFRICTFMYFITLLMLSGILFYRQFYLQQPVHEFEDIAVILTVNSIFLLCAVFYFGGIPFGKIRIRAVAAVFALLSALGFLFILVKYRIVLEPPLSYEEIFEKSYIVVTICGLLTVVFALPAYFGQRKIDRELDNPPD